MISQFNQPRGSTSIEVNKQSIARNFGVKEDEVIYFTVGIDLSGFKVIYDESTQRLILFLQVLFQERLR
ncbi:tail spike protein [Salmonella phage ST-W77]|uniref:Tail fibers protein n=2 Tax=Kuttervirus STW77 TaxID=2846109 RepID=A0A678PBG2_9CAUD|nr:tail spike protein [Salmonella phage ST-W77]ARB12244.1 tail fibers protein [Salmonella phage ST-W77]QQO39005.1 tail fibers protein [Salmonella phage SPHG3]